MSLTYKRRYQRIARGQWDFARQTKRERHKFFRHLTEEERRLEKAGQLPRIQEVSP